MTDNSKYNEQIDRFLKGKMYVEEEQQFKAEIAKNPELKQLVREHLYLIRGIKQVKSQEEKNIIQNAKHAQKVTPLRWNWIRISSIAASVAVIMVLSGIWGRNLYYRYEVRQYAYNTSIVIMSDFDTYSRGATDEAEINHLKTLFTNAQDGNDLSKTIEELSQLYALTKDDYVDAEDDYAFQIGWFLAVAYVNDTEYNHAYDVISDLECNYQDNEKIIIFKSRLSKKI